MIALGMFQVNKQCRMHHITKFGAGTTHRSLFYQHSNNPNRLPVLTLGLKTFGLGPIRSKVSFNECSGYFLYHLVKR